MKSENNNEKQNKNETITELAHRHAKDESHTTTNEELKNARVVLSDNVKADEQSLFEVDNTTIIPPLAEESSENRKDNEDEKNDERFLPNPYDVLGG